AIPLSTISILFSYTTLFRSRRSYDIPPAPLAPDDPRTSYNDPRYADLAREQIPLTECLKAAVARVAPLWDESIAPDVRSGKRVRSEEHTSELQSRENSYAVF